MRVRRRQVRIVRADGVGTGLGMAQRASGCGCQVEARKAGPQARSRQVHRREVSCVGLACCLPTRSESPLASVDVVDELTCPVLTSAQSSTAVHMLLLLWGRSRGTGRRRARGTQGNTGSGHGREWRFAAAAAWLKPAPVVGWWVVWQVLVVSNNPTSTLHHRTR